MDKKRIMAIIIVLVLFIGIVIFNFTYKKKTVFTYLVCSFDSSYSNYNETLRFKYYEDTLYEYEREEWIGATADDSLDDIFNFFLQKKDEIKKELGEDFKYNIEEDGDRIHIYTYIKTVKKFELYNSYIESKEISMDSTLDEVKKKLEKEYTCQVIKR